MNGPLDHARGLLEKARHDPIAGNATVATGEAFDTVCFHAQQAVEKSLKAILALDDVAYPWRHDLRELLELFEPLSADLAPHAQAIVGLTSYAVAGRHDERVDPDEAEARDALHTAQLVYGCAVQAVQTREQATAADDSQ